MNITIKRKEYMHGWEFHIKELSRIGPKSDTDRSRVEAIIIELREIITREADELFKETV